MAHVDSVFSPSRRRWLLGTCLLLTVMVSWSSFNRLSELVEVQQVDVGRHSLLELAEENIASHLHVREAVAGARALGGRDRAQGGRRGSPSRMRTSRLSPRPPHRPTPGPAAFRGQVGDHILSSSASQQQAPAAAGGGGGGGGDAGASSSGSSSSSSSSSAKSSGTCKILPNTE